MLMPGAAETDAALAANVAIVRASFDSVMPGEKIKLIKHLDKRTPKPLKLSKH